MKKILRFLIILLLISVFLFGININTCQAVANEINKNINTNNEVNKVEENLLENKNVKENDKVDNNVNTNVSNETVNKTQNEIDNTVKEEGFFEKNNINKSEVQLRANISGSEVIVSGTTNRITTKLSGRAVGTDGGSNENGADINLWDDISVSQQRFIFQYNKEGYYSIINEKSGKLLDVVGSGMNSGTAVDQWEDNGGYDNQKWIIQDAGNGYYNIISKLSGMYLTVNGTGANCDLLCVANKTGKDNQKFQIVEKGTPKGESTVEEGIYKIVLANAPTQSLTVDGGKTGDGANVHIWEYVNSAQQQFKLEYDGKGYYEIIPMHSGKRLDVVGYGNEANVDQWSDNGGNDNQKWVIRKSASGNYNIISKRDAMYLDAYQSKTTNGTNIEVYEQSRGAGQEFKLEKIEEDKNEEDEIVDTKTVEEGTYKIVLANAPQQSLTVDGGKTADGANVHYEIIPLNSGKRLDVVGYGNEANVDQWSNNGGNDNQKWAIRKSASGNYNIISKRQGLYLDAYQSKTANGTNIQVYEKSGGAGQEFKLEKIGDKSERTVTDGVYKISPKSNTNIVVEASGSNKDNNGRIQIWQNYNVIAQKLNIEYKDGFYKITMRHSGKSLTVKDNNLVKGADIVQCDYQGLDSQKWILRDCGKGLVISLLSNPDLSITVQGNIENGSKLVLSKTQDNNNQIFQLQIAQVTIVINPGHGGSDPGCANGWIVEKNVTLNIAKKIQANLSKYSDVNVILTRTGDYYMDLAPRAMIARNNNADLYISLHINDEASHRATGSQMYVPFYEGTRHYNSNMTKLANLIQDKLGAIGIRENLSGGITRRNIDQLPKYQYLMDGKVVQADYYADIRHAMKGDTMDYGPDLNTNTGIPTILVEHCFMNSSDSQFLDSDYDLQRIANCDSEAIIEYFNL